MTAFPNRETVMKPMAMALWWILLSVEEIMELPTLQSTFKHLRHSIQNNPIKKGNNICAQTTLNHPAPLIELSSM